MTTQYYLGDREIAVSGSMGVTWSVDPNSLPRAGSYSACSGGYTPEFSSWLSMVEEMNGGMNPRLHMVECWMHSDDINLVLRHVGELRFFSYSETLSSFDIKFGKAKGQYFGFQVSMNLFEDLDPALRAKILTHEQYKIAIRGERGAGAIAVVPELEEPRDGTTIVHNFYAHGEAEEVLGHDLFYADWNPQAGTWDAVLSVSGKGYPAKLFAWEAQMNSRTTMIRGVLVLAGDKQAIKYAKNLQQSKATTF